MMKLVIHLLAALFVAFAQVAHGQNQSDGDFFPIMAWNNIRGDASVMQRLHDCGFTVAGFVAAPNLDLCHAAGLKAIVSDPRASGYDWAHVDEAQARRNIESLVKDVGNHPAVYGYNLRDEPSAGMFPGLQTVASQIAELSPGKWAYINLFPNYAIPRQLQSDSYETYIEEFISTCHPTHLCYDHYALMENGSLREGYWQNLEVIRKASIRHNIPFWNIVLAVGHFNYRVPTWDDLRFQAYSTLAYGARGLAYFTYFSPAVGNFRGAAIDQFGNETPTWSYLQNVNLQILKLAPTLNRLRSDDVYHLGRVPEGCHGSNEDNLVKTAPNADFVVGDFTHEDGSRYVLIVNKDLVNSRHCTPEFRKGVKTLQLVSPYTGKLIKYGGEHFWLAPGQGHLLKVEFD